MFELIFLKILLQLSIFSLQTVPKYYSSNFQEQKDFDRKSHKATSTEKTLFCYTANPSKCQICKWSIYEIKLTLLCETTTYFILNYLVLYLFLGKVFCDLFSMSTFCFEEIDVMRKKVQKMQKKRMIKIYVLRKLLMFPYHLDCSKQVGEKMEQGPIDNKRKTYQRNRERNVVVTVLEN